MYAQIVRRQPNPARREETLQRARSEFFPKLQQAPGFHSFTLVASEDGRNTAIVLWEDQASAEAFGETQLAWNATLAELGNREEARTVGEVVTHVGRQR